MEPWLSRRLLLPIGRQNSPESAILSFRKRSAIGEIFERSICRKWNPFHHYNIINDNFRFILQSVTLGLTGNIEFNEKGFRKNYKLKVFELLYFDEDATHIAELVKIYL